MIRVGIIGFGLSGIACARWALHYGYEPVVFERNTDIGGVWLTHNYIGCVLQTTKHSYHYSDMPMPDNYPLYPSGDQVKQYLDNYVAHHKLRQYVYFNTSITKIVKENFRWLLTDQNGDTYTLNYVLITTGYYGDFKENRIDNSVLPYEIKYPDNQLRNKRVVIVGNGPSGCDMAVLSRMCGAKSTTLLYRSPRWIFARRLGGLSLHFFTWRFFLHLAYILPKPILRICLILLYIIPIIWYGYKLDIEYPSEKVNRDNLVLNDTIYYFVSEGSIRLVKDPLISVKDQKVIAMSETEYPFDILIDATGYKTGIPLLGYYDSIPKLYRNILLPGERTLGIIGFVPTFSWTIISELQTHWFFWMIREKFQLPNELEPYLSKTDDRDYAFLIYDYMNELQRDMGWKELKNWFSLPKISVIHQ